MAHAARAHWISSLIMMAVTASCITWIIISKKDIKPSISRIDGTLVADMFRNLSFPAYSTYKVKNFSTNSTVVWEKEEDVMGFSLDKSKTWITVEEEGVYLCYVQLTYSLKKDGDKSSEDLVWYMKLEVPEETSDFVGAFDTRQLTDKMQDAQLSGFFLLHLKAGNRLSIVAYPETRINLNVTRPFSSYITFVRIADW